jgi:hypothetical protein
MSHPRYTSEEIVRRGQALYEERLRPMSGLWLILATAGSSSCSTSKQVSTSSTPMS